jgi:hypothetical protein
VKLIHLLVVVAFLGISASVARADGVDPIVRITGVCQSNCDAVVIGPGQTSVGISETIACFPGATNGLGCTANEDVINFSGATLTAFDLSLSSPGLTFGCLSTGTYICTDLGGGLFAFTVPTGGTPFCSTDGNDISPTFDPSNPGPYTFVADNDADDNCSVIQIGLQGTATETVKQLDGAVVTGTLNTPEPSSALLLLFGLMAGVVVLKFSRTSLA